jgi:PAT family beta-lactamase induction signal transducer AmpG
MPKENLPDLSEENESRINPWAWISTLYFAEGIPYIVVMVVSTIMYKNLGISNSDIAFYTSWLYLPWVIKFAWSPFVDILKTKRFWIVIMQLVLGVGFAGVALTLPADNFFRYSLAFLWLLAFSSATHDIAADGFYMLALREDQQAFFVGIRSTFYRIAMITGQGLFVILAGFLEEKLDIVLAWQITMGVAGGLMVLLYLYHAAILPRVEEEPEESSSFKDILNELVEVIVQFFKKKQILLIIPYILLYRLGEAQLAKIASPFLLDGLEVGGLALSTKEVGLIYGTIGVIFLVAGGIIGGILASRDGLKAWIWWMVAAINIPNVVYIYLAATQPSSFYVISTCVAIEQFGYGFGFTAFMLYLIYVADGEHKTAHFAFCTALMALGMMIPGMFSGDIQEALGYQNFFIWVLIATIPAFILTYFIPLNPEFGKKTK